MWAVTIHLASGQTLRSDIHDLDNLTDAELLRVLQGEIQGPPGWRTVAGLLVYSQVVSAIEIERIGGSQ